MYHMPPVRALTTAQSALVSLLALWMFLPVADQLQLVVAHRTPLTALMWIKYDLAKFFADAANIEPDFETKTEVSLSSPNIKVAVLCDASPKIKWESGHVDNELAKYVSYRLSQNQIQVIDPHVVQAWLEKTGDNWDRPDKLGLGLDADFVIFIQLNEFGLYEDGSQNDLFRGHSEPLITVHSMEYGDCNEIYSKELMSKFPMIEAVPSSEISFRDFKRTYLARLSDEIGRHFYDYGFDHEADEEIPTANFTPQN